jgi:ABC-type uncharacterized transport system auxiliary subunit
MRNILYASVLLFCVGCSSEQRIIKFYTIDMYEPGSIRTEERVIEEPLPYVAEIARFTIAGPYNQNRIALRTGTHELQYYYYHHWADLPGSAAMYFVWQHIKNAQVFAYCELQLYETLPDFEILGTIHRIERVDIGDFTGAHLSMSLDLLRVSDERIEVSHSFERTESLERREGMNSFAGAISKIMYEETNEFIRLIRQVLQHSDE